MQIGLISAGAIYSDSDPGLRNSSDYFLRRRFVKTIGFCLGCFNRRIGLGSVVSLAVDSLAAIILAVDSLAVVSLAVDILAVDGLVVADFDLTRGKGCRDTGSRCSADLKLG